MNLIKTKLEGVYIVEPQVFGDERGWFMETYSKIKTPEINCDFVQDNHSYSKEKGTLRGIHFQNGKYAQAKLVRCVRGVVLDVAVDLRKHSATFGQWVGEILSEENKKMLWVPPGFAHGFVVLSSTADFLYKTTDYYAPKHERCIIWDDETLAIDWPIDRPPSLSAEDQEGVAFKDAEVYDE